MRRIGLFAVLYFGFLSALSGCGGSNSISSANPTQPPSSQPGTNPTPNITVPTPGIAALSPQSVMKDAAVVPVSGTGFEANSVAQWNGQPRPTTYVNATTLQLGLNSADVMNFGTGQVSVTNPGLAPAQPIPHIGRPLTPVITSINPNSIAAIPGSKSPEQVVINGALFAPEATVQANGQQATVVSRQMLRSQSRWPPASLPHRGRSISSSATQGTPLCPRTQPCSRYPLRLPRLSPYPLTPPPRGARIPSLPSVVVAFFQTPRFFGIRRRLTRRTPGHPA